MSQRIPSKKTGGHDVQKAIGAHANAILFLCVFTLLSVFALALWMVKIDLGTSKEVVVFPENASDARVTSLELGDIRVSPKTTGGVRVAPSETADELGATKIVDVGLRPEFGVTVYATPLASCPAGIESSDCNDYSLVGPYGVVLPSVRNTMAAAGLNSSGFPIALTLDHQVLILRAGDVEPWVMRNTLVTVNLLTGDVARFPNVVHECLTFSYNGTLAADIKKSEGQRDEIYVHDILHGKSKMIARASEGEVFAYEDYPNLTFPESLNCAGLNFDNSTSVKYHAYPEEEGDVASRVQERTIELKF